MNLPRLEREDVPLVPLALYGVAKGVVELVTESDVVERYKPRNVEEVVETVGLVVGVAGLAVSACAIYQELKR